MKGNCVPTGRRVYVYFNVHALTLTTKARRSPFMNSLVGYLKRVNLQFLHQIFFNLEINDIYPLILEEYNS